MTEKDKLLDAEALAFHANGRPGKFQIAATKPLTSQHDLSLAYSPGVAAPCLEIAADINTAYDYTNKGNQSPLSRTAQQFLVLAISARRQRNP